MLSKISRIQSYAKVSFCDPIVIRYGTGMTPEMNELNGTNSDGEGSNQESGDIPCPILEFRVTNLLSSINGGEIIDATVNIVSSIAPDQVPTNAGAGTRRRRKGKKARKAPPKKNHLSLADQQDAPSSTSLLGEKPTLGNQRSEMLKSMKSRTSGLVGDADRSWRTGSMASSKGRPLPKRVFAKVEVESPEHPFFKHIWMLQHNLDENSPLLKNFARQMIIRNKGFWPPELNSHEAVRSAVKFDSILVSLSGTSNADRNSVYSQKMYFFTDVNIGYQFVNMLYKEPSDGSLQVDHRLLSDVVEQQGGGGEPFNEAFEEVHNDMIVL
jgi:hypothetical protein